MTTDTRTEPLERTVKTRSPKQRSLNDTTEHPDGPWRDGRFYLLQAVVLILALGRLTLEVALGKGGPPPADELSTMGLFFIPVLYAALNLGTLGALLTTAWSSVLTVPYAIEYLRDGNHTGVWAECLQIVVLCALALLVSQRVTAERGARLHAEGARHDHLAAEIRYHGLFDSNVAPIILVDDTGSVLEANAAAIRVFGDAIAVRSNSMLHSVVGYELESAILGRGQGVDGQAAALAPRKATPGSGVVATETLRHESPLGVVLFRLRATQVADPHNRPATQIVFEDVTTETRRQELAEAYAIRVLHAQEEERRHIAQELHDGPLQSLIHLCRHVDNALAGEGLPQSISTHLADLRIVAEDVVAELRGISRGLRPSVLDDLGLTTSIDRLLSDAQSRSDLVTNLAVNGDVRRLPPSVELALFRIAQEALTNVEHHSGAASVEVEIRFDPESVHLEVSDDGRGFDIPGAEEDVRPGSLGMSGMQERAHLAGGHLEVHTSGEGTVVSAWIPAGRQNVGQEQDAELGVTEGK